MPTFRRRSGAIVSCGAAEDKDRYDREAKVDDARQYGVWGVDGIRQRSASFAAMEEDWEGEVSAVWAAAGASEVAIQRLLILGAKWQKGPLGEVYRDAEAVSCMVRTLEDILPGANAAAVFHSEPAAALVCVDRATLTKKVVTLRTGVGIQRLDIARMVSHEPRLLLLEDDESGRATSGFGGGGGAERGGRGGEGGGSLAGERFRAATAAVRDSVVGGGRFWGRQTMAVGDLCSVATSTDYTDFITPRDGMNDH